MSDKYRLENDLIGECKVPYDALYGIHSLRAKINFPYSVNSSSDLKFDIDWYKSIGKIKLAYYTSYEKFIKSYNEKYSNHNDKPVLHVPQIDNKQIDALKQAANEISQGQHYEHFIVPPIQGGAGTSINMNINESIANRAMQISNQNTSPFDHSNIFQSTNDVIPSALKIAAISKLDILENSIDLLRKEFEILENKYRDSLRMGYTEMMYACLLYTSRCV